jgi:hypothetical protein
MIKMKSYICCMKGLKKVSILSTEGPLPPSKLLMKLLRGLQSDEGGGQLKPSEKLQKRRPRRKNKN